MITMNEYIAKLTKVRDNFNTLLADQLASGRAAENMVALIVERAEHKGLDFNNNKFSKYSQRPLRIHRSMFKTDYAWKAATREAIKYTIGGHVAFLLQGGYKRIRELENLQTDFKDFHFTGSMWKDFRVTGFAKTTTTITFKQSGTSEQYKIDANSEREGKSIIAPSKQELDKWAKTVQFEVNKILDIK